MIECYKHPEVMTKVYRTIYWKQHCMNEWNECYSRQWLGFFVTEQIPNMYMFVVECCVLWARSHKVNAPAVVYSRWLTVENKWMIWEKGLSKIQTLTSTDRAALAVWDDHPGTGEVLAGLVFAPVESIPTFTCLALVNLPSLAILHLLTVIRARLATLWKASMQD